MNTTFKAKLCLASSLALALNLASCRFGESSSDVASVPTAKKVDDEQTTKVNLGKISLSFYAIGNISIKKRLFVPQSFVVEQNVKTTLDGDTLTIDVSEAKTTSKGTASNEVNKSLSKKNGPRVYSLASKTDLIALKKDNPDVKKVASVVMFAKTVTSEGKSWDMKPALPVYVLPTDDVDRYKNITDEGLTFSGTLNDGSRDYAANVKVRKIMSDDTKIQIEVTWDLPDDKKGELYGQLPMAKVSAYEVDLNSKVVNRLWTNSSYVDKDSEQQSNFLYRLCSYEDELNDKNNKTFDGCRDKTAKGEVMGRPQ